jgi:hypothetical protein
VLRIPIRILGSSILIRINVKSRIRIEVKSGELWRLTMEEPYSDPHLSEKIDADPQHMGNIVVGIGTFLYFCGMLIMTFFFFCGST